MKDLAVEKRRLARGALNSLGLVIGTKSDMPAIESALDAYAALVWQGWQEQIHDLAECYRLSGADPDGNEDWRLARDAVAEVKRLRAEYDAQDEEIARLREALKGMQAIGNNLNLTDQQIMFAVLEAARAALSGGAHE